MNNRFAAMFMLVSSATRAEEGYDPMGRKPYMMSSEYGAASSATRVAGLTFVWIVVDSAESKDGRHGSGQEQIMSLKQYKAPYFWPLYNNSNNLKT